MMDKNKEKEKENGVLFSKGSKVEVSSDEEGFKDAWFVAIVLKSPHSTTKRKGMAFIEYQTLLADNKRYLLKEYVDASFIRPLPPPAQPTDQSFDVYDVVDAFYSDGWWKGVIRKVKVLKDNKSQVKRYTVFFENPAHQLDFGASDLRFHWDWTNGGWVRPPKKLRMDGLKFDTGVEVEVNLGKEYPNDQWFPAVVLDEVGFNSFLVKRKILSNNNESGFMTVTVDSFHIRPPPPNTGAKNFKLLEQVDVFYDSGWGAGYVTKTYTEGRYTVFLEHAKVEKEFILSEIRPHIYFMNGNWVNGMKDLSITTHSQEWSGHANSNNAEIMEVTSPRQCLKSAEGNLTAVKKVKQSALRNEATISRPSKKFKRENFTNPENAANPLSSQACHVKSMPIETPNQKAEIACGKLIKCSNHPVGRNKPSADKIPGKVDIVEIIEVEAGLETEMMVSMEDRERLTNACIKSELGSTAVELEKDSAEDIVDIENITKEVDLSVAITDGAMRGIRAENSCVLSEKEVNLHKQGDANQQQKGEEHIPTGDVASKMDCEDCATKKVDLPMATGVKPAVNSELVGYQEVPFVKSSSIWEYIESLDVFQSMPQKPHFHLLVKYPEIGREGLAIGHMVTFATLVEKASKLKIDDPKSIFDSFLNALDDLEMLGFDVNPVVDRLNKLLSIKDRRGQLQDQSKKVEIQIADQTHEKTKLEVIFSIEKMINELEEKRALNTSMKEKKESEITTLQTDASIINADIWKSEHEFESLAAASWSLEMD